ncbi:MAG: hypothetical protein JXA44_00910 [Methanospirillaceae archaeon]|nr:hypothetical protein [Methanospirillaceae archaeon]
MNIHLDEARNNTLTFLRSLLKKNTDIEKIIFIEDVFSRFRIIYWTQKPYDFDKISATIEKTARPFWSQEYINISVTSPAYDREFYDQSWDEGKEDDEMDSLRILERHRNRRGWFEPFTKPLWLPLDPGNPRTPPIITFYSFKGGIGRTTGLAAFAIDRAHAGERVVVLDCDLDAPGIDRLITGDPTIQAPWGIVDYLLEAPLIELPLTDYKHRCQSEKITGEGEILVFPAGKLDDRYPEKLARIDLNQSTDDSDHPLMRLISRIAAELIPDWILIDARSGLSEISGLVLSDLSHLLVLYGTTSEQSWDGLRYIIERAGKERINRDTPQQPCIIVQSLIPEVKSTPSAQEWFETRSLDLFSEIYYREDPEDPSEREENYWYLTDINDEKAPHLPVGITYSPGLAFFHTLSDIVPDIRNNKDFQALVQKIYDYFKPDV